MANYSDIFNGAISLWVSGATVAKHKLVISPADNEVYQRITAAGGGATDPADDVTNYVARSYVRTAALPAPRPFVNISGVSGLGLTASTLTGLALNTRTSFLSITGRGVISSLITTRVSVGGLRTEILVDGLAVFDQVDVFTGTYHVSAFLGSPGSVNTGSNYPDSYSASSNGITFVRSFQVFLTPTNASGGGAAGNGVGVGYVLERSTA